MFISKIHKISFITPVYVYDMINYFLNQVVRLKCFNTKFFTYNS